MARRLNRRRKNKGESRVAIVQRTAETADIEKIKLEANERNVRKVREEFESARASRPIYDREETCIIQ